MKSKLCKSLIVFSVLLLLSPQNIIYAHSRSGIEDSLTNIEKDKSYSETPDPTQVEKDSSIEQEESTVESNQSSIDSESKGEAFDKKRDINDEDELNSDKDTAEETNDQVKDESKSEEIENEKQEEKNNNKIQSSNIPEYTIGDEGQHVVQLKKDLRELGYGSFPVNPSERYGSVTANVVKEFQKTFGLQVTGEADSRTLEAIADALSSEYRNGKRGSHVRELKENLTLLGFGNFPPNPSKVFGAITANVVKEFQAYNGLQVTGIADSQTLEKIAELLDGPYENGDKGQHVVQLKKDLRELGYGNFPANPSERYGSVTANVVKEFQQNFGLKITGKADSSTLKAIADALSSEYRNGKRGSHVRELKQDLTQLGFGNFPSNPSINYGSVTANVVKDFQNQYKLPMTGIADAVTRNKIKEILNPPYKNGDQGLHISQLKKDLKELGFGNFPSEPSINYGSVTASVVEDFQKVFSLKVSGVVDQKTLNKLNDIISSDYRVGKRGTHVRNLKKDLTQLGFGNFPSNPSINYGSVTANVVKDFQSQYKLPITGVADTTTRKKIKEILSPPYKNGDQGLHISQLKQDLKELGFGNFPSEPSINYGSVTARVVKDFQRTHDLKVTGNANKETLNKISELKKGLNFVKYNYSLEEAVEIQMAQMPQTDKHQYAWVSKNYIDSNRRVTASKLNVRPNPNSSGEPLGTLSKGTKVDIIDEKGNWYAIKYSNNAWVHAIREDIRYYLDPKNFINDQRQRFQFLDLSKRSGAPKSVLNNYLKGKGVLQGQGQAFIDAARAHGVNDIYLISHSILETGNGTSNLAKGVEVGLNRKGKPKLVTDSNRKSLTEIKKVYNMYGIGAVDSNALRGGAIRAYEENWDTVSKAIIGGAEFIGNGYIKAGQNTLYKMRWNPLMNEGMAWKQYATDIGWASKQVNTMYNLYQEIGFDTPILDIPEYKK